MKKNLDVYLTLFTATALAIAMLTPIPEPPSTPTLNDKIVHIIAFATLALPIAITGRQRLILIFIMVSAFGGLIELVQPTFNRSAELNDWLADILGACLGTIIGFAYRSLKQKLN